MLKKVKYINLTKYYLDQEVGQNEGLLPSANSKQSGGETACFVATRL